jgi:hypothetical protein
MRLDQSNHVDVVEVGRSSGDADDGVEELSDSASARDTVLVIVCGDSSCNQQETFSCVDVSSGTSLVREETIGDDTDGRVGLPANTTRVLGDEPADDCGPSSPPPPPLPKNGPPPSKFDELWSTSLTDAAAAVNADGDVVCDGACAVVSGSCGEVAADPHGDSYWTALDVGSDRLDIEKHQQRQQHVVDIINNVAAAADDAASCAAIKPLHQQTATADDWAPADDRCTRDNMLGSRQQIFVPTTAAAVAAATLCRVTDTNGADGNIILSSDPKFDGRLGIFDPKVTITMPVEQSNNRLEEAVRSTAGSGYGEYNAGGVVSVGHRTAALTAVNDDVDAVIETSAVHHQPIGLLQSKTQVAAATAAGDTNNTNVVTGNDTTGSSVPTTEIFKAKAFLTSFLGAKCRSQHQQNSSSLSNDQRQTSCPEPVGVVTVTRQSYSNPTTFGTSPETPSSSSLHAEPMYRTAASRPGQLGPMPPLPPPPQASGASSKQQQQPSLHVAKSPTRRNRNLLSARANGVSSDGNNNAISTSTTIDDTATTEQQQQQQHRCPATMISTNSDSGHTMVFNGHVTSGRHSLDTESPPPHSDADFQSFSRLQPPDVAGNRFRSSGGGVANGMLVASTSAADGDVINVVKSRVPDVSAGHSSGKRDLLGGGGGSDGRRLIETESNYDPESKMKPKPVDVFERHVIVDRSEVFVDVASSGPRQFRVLSPDARHSSYSSHTVPPSLLHPVPLPNHQLQQQHVAAVSDDLRVVRPTT